MLTKINNVYRLKYLVKFSRCVWTVSTKENNVLSLKNEQQYEMKFPFVWLRDNCRCSQCFHKDSNSRTIHIQKFNFKAVPVKTNVNDKQLEIEWDDNHKSNFLLPWLKERQFTSEAQNKWKQNIFKDTKVTWTTEEYPKILKKTSFDKILESDEELLSWLESLSIYGVALIENAGAKDGTVEKLAEKVAFTKKTQYGNTFKVEAKPGTTNVAYLNAPLQLHTDLPYYHYKPGINLLHCIVQGEGGESQLADSFAIAKELKENNYSVYSILKETNIVWSDQCYEDGRNYHSVNISPVICEDNDGEIERINFSQPQRDSQLNVPLEKVQPWYDALQVFSQMMYSEQFMIQYQMKPGEIITFDNLRLVHGRADYNGHRCVEGAYLDWDHIYSRIRVLRSKLKRM